MPQFVWMGKSGCLIPCLIIFNLFFGKSIFNSTRIWLGIEAVLILIFIININLMVRKISRQFGQKVRGLASDSQSHGQKGRGWQPKSQRQRQDDKVVDIEGHIVEDEKKLK